MTTVYQKITPNLTLQVIKNPDTFNISFLRSEQDNCVPGYVEAEDMKPFMDKIKFVYALFQTWRIARKNAKRKS